MDLEDETFDEGLQAPGQPQIDANVDGGVLEDVEDLFGGDEDDEPGPRGDAGGGLQPPSPGPEAVASEADERRRVMQELAKRHWQQQEEEEEGGGGGSGEDGGGDGDDSAKKKKKKRKHKDKSRHKDRGGSGDEGGERRPRRLRKAGGGDGDAGDGDAERAGAAAAAGLEDEDAPPLEEDDADRAFIDDDGVPEHLRYRDNPDVDAALEPEAEEADEDEDGGARGGARGGRGEGGGDDDDEEDVLGGAGKRKRKREQDTDAQLVAATESMVAKMNIAAELDEACVAKGRPATHKVRELPAVEAFLRARKHHELFIVHGGLEAAARWVTPYPNGDVPTLLVRARVAALLALLPLDTRVDGLRDLLTRSGLGRIVNFNATADFGGAAGGAAAEREEAVKRAYRKLLQGWLAPIVADPEAEAEKRAKQSAALARQRQLALARTKAEADALAARRAEEAKVAPGEKGFRRHAYIPTAAKLDYVTNPGREQGVYGGGGGGGRRRGDDDEDEDNDGGVGAMAAVAREPGAARRGGGGAGGSGPELSPLAKKMAAMQRARKASTARAAKVSVEGRNITLM